MNKVSLLVLLSFVLYVGGVNLAEFYPHGKDVGDEALSPNDDSSTTPINLTVPFPFFDVDRDVIFVNNNGIISFSVRVETYTPNPFPLDGDTELIAPFWGDVDTREIGTVLHRQTADSELLERAANDIRRAFVDHADFSPSFLIIATWSDVGYFNERIDKTNTFQCIMATDGQLSFVIFLYADGLIQWTTGDASGGTGGLGGTAAQVGFNAGDGVRFATVPGSRTPAVINITQTSNVRVPGMWVFQVDEDIRPGGCVKKSSEVVPLDISPRYGNVLGGESITVAGVCFNEGDEIMCVFDGVETHGIYLNELEALCVVPLLTTIGRVPLELYVKGNLKARTTFTTLSIPRGHKVDILTDSLLLAAGTDVQLAWTPTSIFPALPSTDYKIDVFLYSYSVTEEAWKQEELLVELTDNSGTITVTLPTALQSTVGHSNPVPIAIQLFVSHLGALTDLHQSLILADIRAGVWTSQYYFGTNQLSVFGFLICGPWHVNEPSDIDQILVDRTGACPPTEARALLPNSGVKPERFISFFGNTLYENQHMNFFHPDASSCYVQRASPRETEGSSLQCCYDNNGDLIVGSPGGGAIKLVSEETSYTQNLVSDVFPYIQCCQTSLPQCSNFYERRPSDDGSDFNPPPPAWTIGDPHLVSLDGLKYTFNGHGEFVMIESENVSIQARMVAATDEEGNTVGATVISAVVAREGESDRVQFTYNSRRGLDVLINEERIQFEDVALFFELPFNGVAITNHGSNTVSAAFSGGMAIQVKESNGFLSALMVSLPESLRGLTTGLLGNYNGDPSDDLLPRAMSMPLSAQSSIRDIHEQFGTTWIVANANESLFYYKEGESWQTFNELNSTFVPSYEPVFSDPILEQQAVLLCNGDQTCLFDIAVSGRIDVGLSTLTASQEVTLVTQLSLPVLCDPPCESGACVATNTCRCSLGYAGATCTDKVYSECENASVCGGGECRSHAGTYICSCPSQYATEICTEEEVEGRDRTVPLAVVAGSAALVAVVLVVAVTLVLMLVVFLYRRKQKDNNRSRRQSRKNSVSSSAPDPRGSCILNGLGTSQPTSTDNLLDSLQNGRYPHASTFVKHTDV